MVLGKLPLTNRSCAAVAALYGDEPDRQAGKRESLMPQCSLAHGLTDRAVTPRSFRSNCPWKENQCSPRKPRASHVAKLPLSVRYQELEVAGHRASGNLALRYTGNTSDTSKLSMLVRCPKTQEAYPWVASSSKKSSRVRRQSCHSTGSTAAHPYGQSATRRTSSAHGHM